MKKNEMIRQQGGSGVGFERIGSERADLSSSHGDGEKGRPRDMLEDSHITGLCGGECGAEDEERGGHAAACPYGEEEGHMQCAPTEGNGGGNVFGSRVRARRNELGLTLTDVAMRVGCRESYLSMIETGRRPPPAEELLSALEEVLLLEAGQLVENARWLATPASVRRQVEELQDRSRRTEALIAQLRRGPRDLDAMLKSGELQRLVEEHVANIEGMGVVCGEIPVINKVAAGYPRDFTDLGYPARVADEYLACPDSMVAQDSQAFAARVVGDSMEPEYHEGDTVVFSPDAPTPAGSDCFVRLEPDSETTFKRVFFEGDDDEFVRLEPLNGAYRSRRVHREEIAGMYAAVYVMRPVRVR